MPPFRFALSALVMFVDRCHQGTATATVAPSEQWYTFYSSLSLGFYLLPFEVDPLQRQKRRPIALMRLDYFEKDTQPDASARLIFRDKTSGQGIFKWMFTSINS